MAAEWGWEFVGDEGENLSLLEPDLRAIDDVLLFMTNEGEKHITENWSTKALYTNPNWAKIRKLSLNALDARGLATFCPHPDTDIVIGPSGVMN
ncbi:hypothetical protein GCM10007928_47980 [Sulfitobacter porphyrae]|nr:hypothetical protein GCM10007928_47980 [Sulfitobacter porphyrae]